MVGVAATTRPAIASEAPVPRMVVFSSPSLADNRLLRTEATNIDLLMNAVSWLRGKPDLIGIAPKTHESLLFAADPGLQTPPGHGPDPGGGDRDHRPRPDHLDRPARLSVGSRSSHRRSTILPRPNRTASPR